MKLTIVPLLILFSLFSLSAQNCPKPQAFADLNVNNLQARILTGGDLFTDGDNGKMIYLPDPAKASTIFNASLWVGGIDPGGNLKISAAKNRHDYTDFSPGPLHFVTGEPFTGGCSNWDVVFSVKQTDIIDFQTTGQSLTTEEKIQQFPSVMGWPARGNPFFAEVHNFAMPNTPQGMAPFYDKDGNGQYDPLNGDLPAVLLLHQSPFIPSQITWCVMNDLDNYDILSNSTQPLGLEVQLTAWAFDCPNKPLIQNTVFTSHKLLYRGKESLFATYAGLFTDFDLGCPEDDYVGCNPMFNTQYAYNSDATDGDPGNSCSGSVTFAGSPPIQSATFLDQEMNSFIPFGNDDASPATGLPESPLEYYRYLSGHWRDGISLTYGGDGYNPGSLVETDYIFTDNPGDTGGWSMCTDSTPAGNKRTVGSIKIGELKPGTFVELSTAWVATPGNSLSCNIGDQLFDVIDIQDIYNSNFNVCGNLLTPVHTPVPEKLNMQPNPATSFVMVSLGNKVISELRITAADRRIVRTMYELTGDQTIPVSDLAKGWYLVQAVSEKGVMNGKLVISDKL